MKFGVFIEKGPQPWQVFQQENGTADISIEGRWDFNVIVNIDESNIGNVQVWAALLDEQDGHQVIPWELTRTNPDNTWNHTFKSVPVGGPYRIETGLRMAGGDPTHDWDFRGDMIHHICVGDLFVIAGQSNAVGYAKDYIFDPPEPGIHMLRSNGTWDMATHPIGDSTNTIHEENTDFSNTGHSPYLTFAKKIKEQVGYPIGLLPTALGGSAIRQWDTEQEGELWREMMGVIHMAGGKISAILWYQGCTDTDTLEQAKAYLEVFERVVATTRKELGAPSLPWFTIQLNRQMCTDWLKPDHDEFWGTVREAQRKAAQTIPGVYVIPATDCTLSDGIHNKAAANMMLGQRLARQVLTKLYGIPVACPIPDIYMAEKTDGGNKLVLHFTDVEEMIITRNGPANNIFRVEDEKGTIPVREISAGNKNMITLTLERAAEGKTLISALWQASPEYRMPVESMCRTPILSFYRFEVKFERVPWRDREAWHFVLNGHESWVVIPDNPLPDKRWAWRTEFFGAFDYADMALVEKGYYLVHHEIHDMYGCPKAIEYMEEFYNVLVEDMKLGKKAVMIGLSRGGLYAYNFALAHPNQVACLYIDAPVLDIRSWPGGKFSGPGEESCWIECMGHYGLTEETAMDFTGNPIDHTKEIAEAGIPVILVAGGADELVPYCENGTILEQRLKADGGKIKTIVKPDCGHHPHSLEDPTQIIEFIEKEGLF